MRVFNYYLQSRRANRFFILVFLAVIFQMTGMVATATAAKNTRTALVIGNAEYRVSPLRNPVNDARDIAATLRSAGFDVTLKLNATLRDMEDAVRIFGKKLRNGGVGLFYYAGHGIQIRGSNYLVPVGAVIESESDVKYGALDAGLILGKMEDAGNKMNIIILDACRNNPFARSFRSANKGLAKMDAPRGSLIAYATAPGSVAADGTDGNGIYTKHLIKNIRTPGLTIEEILKRVRVAVVAETGEKQIPWEASSLMGDFYFQPGSETDKVVQPVAPVVKPQKVTRIDDEEEMWLLVKNSSNIDDIEAFLAAYPKGRFFRHARLKKKQLEKAQKKKRDLVAEKPVKKTPVVSPSRAYDVTDVRFFAGGDVAPDPKNKRYKTVFPRDMSDSVYTEVNIKNHLHKIRPHDHKMLFIYHGPDGKEAGRVDGVFNVKDIWVTAWIQRSWKPKGFWQKGDYKVKVLMDGRQVSEKYFTIDRAISDYQLLDIRFFEAGNNPPDASKRQYRDSFSKRDTRRVWCEVKVKNFRYKENLHSHKVEWIYYNPNGSVRGRMNNTMNIKPEWDTSWIQSGWGWAGKGNWPKGRYKAEVFLDGRKIGTEHFRIY